MEEHMTPAEELELYREALRFHDHATDHIRRCGVCAEKDGYCNVYFRLEDEAEKLWAKCREAMPEVEG